MKLIAYSIGAPKLAIRPAPATRPWLDKLPAAFGYRCLPLNIGSSHGWEILCPTGFVAMWNGGVGLDAMSVRVDKEVGWTPASHFGSGILTFHTRYLFRTEPGFNLFVTGPTNNRKHGIAPLTGLIETDWSPYTFTMNWAFTQPGGLRFEEGEPFCMLFPVPRGLVDSVEPEIRDLAADPETKRRYDLWNNSREQFLRDLRALKPEALEEKWQKHYYRGVLPEGQPAIPAHQIKLRVRPFTDRSGKKVSVRRGPPRIVVKRKPTPPK
ncbi:MAG: hypothetical protein KIT16_09750 [Rhodospirillaceae bacterium]|nr:hypothetical protein [Rhodospirillaceae bacterium]